MMAKSEEVNGSDEPAHGSASAARMQDDSSILGRVVRPARTERKLVLFALSIIVMTLIVGLLLYVQRAESVNDSTVTALTTLAGTGLGFIGGMVSKSGSDD